jgi:exosortase
VSTATQVLEASQKSHRWLFWPGLFCLLFAILYGPILLGLAQNWWADPDYGHGFLVPLFSGYVLWREREKWLAAAVVPSNFGFVVMIAAVGLLIIGSLGAELFTTRLSMLLLLAGMILFLRGWSTLRAVSFPLGFLLLMIPLPVIIYNQIAFPLQLFASRCASSLLELVGVPVLRDGNVLLLSNYALEVVEACSGIRSLISLLALAIAYTYLTGTPRWIKQVLVVLMVPIAVVTNAMRIAGAGVLAHRFGPTAAEGFLHEFSGWVVFVAALLLMFVCHQILQRIDKTRRKSAHV